MIMPPPFTCVADCSIGLEVHWQAPTISPQLYELQVGFAGRPRFLALAQESPSMTIPDLHPGTEYELTGRTLHDDKWSNVTAPIRCSTAALQSGQPWVLPPTFPPTSNRITARVAAPPALVEYRVQGEVAWQRGGIASAPELNLTGLAPSSRYEVRAVSMSNATLISDVVMYRTAAPQTHSQSTFRISELCGRNASAPHSHDYTYDSELDRPCEPDYLPNHDSGSLLADIEFITLMSIHQDHFVPDFNGSVVTRYCLTGVEKPDVDYVSCNGPKATTYRCECNNFIDRCIGRLDTSACAPDPTGHMPKCHCNSSSLAASARYIGRMPVYYPFPDGRFGHNMSCGVPPPSESVYLGEWLSTPEAAQCHPGTLNLPGPNGCTWARRRTQHFVHGFELLELGFNTSSSFEYSQLRQNEHIVNAAFAKHPERCCEC